MKVTENVHPTPIQQPIASQLQNFCTRFNLEQAQHLLHHLHYMALQKDRSSSSTPSTAELTGFYHRLEALLPAIYQLNMLPSVKAASSPCDRHVAQIEHQISVASALDTLHNAMAGNWILLITPPE